MSARMFSLSTAIVLQERAVSVEDAKKRLDDSCNLCALGINKRCNTCLVQITHNKRVDELTNPVDYKETYREYTLRKMYMQPATDVSQRPMVKVRKKRKSNVVGKLETLNIQTNPCDWCDKTIRTCRAICKAKSIHMAYLSLLG